MIRPDSQADLPMRPGATTLTQGEAHPVMLALRMKGPYPLTREAVDDVLTATAPGNFALGYINGDTFSVFYLGRSDSDVGQCLREWVGVPYDGEPHPFSTTAPWQTHCHRRHPRNALVLGHVGYTDSAYTHFAYSYAATADAAYAEEWRLFDSTGGRYGLDNETQQIRA